MSVRSHGTTHVRNYFWNTGLLEWKAGNQPLLEAGTVNLASAMEATQSGSWDVSTNTKPRTNLLDYDGDGNLLYVGAAAPGSSPASALWRISQLTYSGGNLAAQKWADGNENYDNVWNNRTGLSYS